MSVLKKKSFPICIAVGVTCALALTVLLLLPFAWAIHGEALGENMQWPCCLVAAWISVFVPTIIIAKTRGRQALATGGAIASGYVVLAALLCALGGKDYAFGMWLVWLAAVAAAAGLIGAVLSLRQNRRRKRRR